MAHDKNHYFQKLSTSYLYRTPKPPRFARGATKPFGKQGGEGALILRQNLSKRWTCIIQRLCTIIACISQICQFKQFFNSHIHTNLFLPIQRYRKRQLSIWVVHIYKISMVDTAVNLPPPSLILSFANFVMFARICKHYSVNNFKFWIHDYLCVSHFVLILWVRAALISRGFVYLPVKQVC